MARLSKPPKATIPRVELHLAVREIVPIDNGSEFMAELHGAVERANRTHTEEFYEVTDAEPDLESFQGELRAWEGVCNTIRPHQALGYLTPAEYLASVGVDV